jgi:hypothetical protein
MLDFLGGCNFRKDEYLRLCGAYHSKHEVGGSNSLKLPVPNRESYFRVFGSVNVII